MTCNLLNVVPKISSHSAGCTIRVMSSVRSCRSFCSSTIANAATRPDVAYKRYHPRGARARVATGISQALSTGTAGNRSAGTDLAERIGRFRCFRVGGEVFGRVVTEHVLERGARRYLGYVGLQLRGR